MNRVLSLLALLAMAGCDGLAFEPERRIALLETLPRDTALIAGEEFTPRLTIKDQNGDEIDPPDWLGGTLWESGNRDVVDIVGDKAVAIGPGETEIVARLGERAAAATVQVNPVWSEAVTTYGYVIQAAQNAEKPIPVVADRRGLLRLFVTLTGDHSYSPPDLRVELLGRGPSLDTVLTQAHPEVLGRLDESRLAYSYNLEIPAEYVMPGLAARVHYESEQRGVGGSDLFQFDVRETRTFRQRLVPVVSTRRPHLDPTEWVRAQSPESPAMEMHGVLLPFADREITHRAAFYTDNDLVGDVVAWYRVLGEINLLQTQEGTGAYYYGVVALPPGYHGPVGIAFSPGRAAVGYNDPGTFTHEVGHNLNLGHAPCGGAGGPDPRYPYRGGVIGRWGWDPNTGRLVAPNSPDVMGYCQGNDWISWYHFNRALEHRLRIGESVGVTGPVLYVWGTVDASGKLELEPALLMDGQASVPDPHGTHLIEGFGPDGRVVFSHGFTPRRLDHADDRLFGVAVPYSAASAPQVHSVTVSGPGDATTLRDGSHAPLALIYDQGRLVGVQREFDGRGRPSSTARRVISTGLPDEIQRERNRW